MPDRVDGKIHDAIRAAHLYYMQDLTMEAIASEMHTSRSSVSRLISFARSSGLVNITISSPDNAAPLLQNELSGRHGISAHVVPVPSNISDIERLERVALSAARVIDPFMESGLTVGIAWGTTMNAVSRYLVPRELHGVEIVQLNGAGNQYTMGVSYASELLRRFGQAYSAAIQEFPVPALFDDPATRDAMWRERSTKRILDIQARMDLAIFGLGAPYSEVPSHVYSGGYLSKEDYQTMQAEGVAGDVATVFYRQDGTTNGIALNLRASGPDASLIRHVARRVCIVAGPSKAASLRGALAAHLITDLIVDETTARVLLAPSRSVSANAHGRR